MKQYDFFSLSRAVGLVTIVALTPLGATMTTAHDASQNDHGYQTTAANRASDTALNLFRDRQEGERTVRVRSMGNGSYICSPAGFGRSSRCYRN